MELENGKAIEASVTEISDAENAEKKKKRGKRPKVNVDADNAGATPLADTEPDETATDTSDKEKMNIENANLENQTTISSNDIISNEKTEKSKELDKNGNGEIEDEKAHANLEGGLLDQTPKAFAEQTLDEMLFSALIKDEVKDDSVDTVEDKKNDLNLSNDETTAAKLRDMIEDQLEIEPDIEEYYDEGWDDEFLDIPDSFFEDDAIADDINFSEEDETSSIAALLYDDDEVMLGDDYKKSAPVSFTQLRLDMQKIRDDIKELFGAPESEELIEEIEEEFPEEIEGQIAFDEEVYETEKADEADDIENTVEIEDTVDEVQDTKTEKKENTPKRVTPLMADAQEKPKEQPKEHIITIDRNRIKDHSTPTDRLIDGAFEIVEMFVFTLLVIMLITTFVFRHSVVEGSSMENTLFNGDHLIISDLFYQPERGDIVVLEDHSSGVGKPIVKRIIALGGDTVRIDNSMIYVNGKFVNEVDYIFDADLTQYMEEITVPEGHVFVMGDHRRVSFDSEEFGTISEDAILGKVILRFFPFDDIKLFN